MTERTGLVGSLITLCLAVPVWGAVGPGFNLTNAQPQVKNAAGDSTIDGDLDVDGQTTLGADGSKSTFTTTGDLSMPGNLTVTGTADFAGGTVTGDLTFNGGELQTDITGPAPAHSEGKLFYNSTLKQLEYYNDESDISVAVGRAVVFKATNKEGSQIDKGEAVYVSGGAGGVFHVKLALADSFDTSQVLGLAAHDVTNNQPGYFITQGALMSLDTSGFSEGALLYLSTFTAGGLTETRPLAPNFDIPVAVVAVSNPSNGAIGVAPRAPAPVGRGTANQIRAMMTDGSQPTFKTVASSSGTIAVSQDDTTIEINVTADSLTSAEIATNAVGSAELADSAVDLAAIADHGCATDEVMAWNGSAWACAASTSFDEVQSSTFTWTGTHTYSQNESSSTWQKGDGTKIMRTLPAGVVALGDGVISDPDTSPSVLLFGVMTASPTASETSPGYNIQGGNGDAEFAIQLDSGTQNFSASYSEGDASGKGLFMDGSNGNVGINTATPAANFDVAGAAQFGDSGTKVSVTAAGALTAAGDGTFNGGELTVQETDSGGTVSVLVENNSTDADSASFLHLKSDAVAGDIYTRMQTGAGTFSWGVDTGDGNKVKLDIGATPGANTLFSIDPTGNHVGIAEPNAEVHLEVNGDAMFGFGATKSTFTTTGDLSLGGYLGYKSATLSEIQGFSVLPGQAWYCSDCSTSAVCISTGSVAGDVSDISGRTTDCQ